jgi:uncharacterized membrane protein YhfC
MNGWALAIEVAIQLLFPFALAALLVKRLGLKWRIFVFGVLSFVVSQVMETPVAVGVYFLGDVLAEYPWLGFLIVGLVAGVGEEFSRWLGYRFVKTMQRNRTWRGALLYGTGHGGAESILVGLGVIALTVVNVVAPASLPEELLFAGTSWYAYLLGGLVRIFAIALHVSLAVLVLQVFTRRSIAWLFVAMAYHALIDFTVLWLHSATENIFLAEGLVLVYALISLVIIRHFREEPPSPAESIEIHEPLSGASQ